jgi:amino acid transporter
MSTQIDAPPGAPAVRPPAPAPEPTPSAPTIALPPDTALYRAKRRLLGRPLHSEQLDEERLGKPTALAIFASDNLSSSAYATEEILHVLVPYVGIAAFALVVPITIAMLVVLGFLILSYRETIKEYPSSGGAYLVTRDNFGPVVAQVAGASLLTDYVLTVAVSTAAGTAALVSAVDGLAPYRVPISLGFIALVAYGNLRGVRESGRTFAIPTYFFIVNMLLMLAVGGVRYARGDLPVVGRRAEGMIPFGHEGSGLLLGASLFVVMHAFASGGAAVTGVEAISNGVTAFRKPEARNARQTLVMMGGGLAVMFLGLSLLASKIKVAPFEDGTPTVIAQIGEAVYGHSALGKTLFYALQVGTLLILVLAANTGFAGFPRLASFQAADKFLPRQLTKRGHRLVYSNGIIALACAAAALVVITGAEVTHLIPLYAVGVFTGFTLSQAGMTRHHLRKRQPGWRRGLVINATGGVLSLVVLVIIAATKFTEGAWFIVVMLPVLVVLFLRVHRQYQTEAAALEQGVHAAALAPILRRHVVLVFVDQLDLAAARAIQYARTLTPDELRAVHFVVDDDEAQHLAQQWRRLGLSRVPLELVACPDRRLTRAAVETTAYELSDGETEVSVLLPDRKYRGPWHRILHDRTADAILAELSRLAHANVTTVPFQLESWVPDEALALIAPTDQPPDDATPPHLERVPRHDTENVTAIAQAQWRDRVRVRGHVRSVRVAPRHDVPTYECDIDDTTGRITAVFLGRRELAAIQVGTRLEVTGTVGIRRGRLAILNPSYRVLPA